MSPEQLVQVRKVLEFKSAIAKRAFEDQRQATYARNSADGVLQSGATIRLVIRMMEELSWTFLAESIEQVSAVSQDQEAFANLQAGFAVLWSYFSSELHTTVKLAGGRSVREDGLDSTSTAARKLFEETGVLLRKRLELYRFTFTKPAEILGRFTSAAPSTATPVIDAGRSAKGGRPLAEHWDAMWAEIAHALYTGDLMPKSQADVENAMLCWLESNGLGAATSTVRGRARRLWDRLQAEN